MKAEEFRSQISPQKMISFEKNLRWALSEVAELHHELVCQSPFQVSAFILPRPDYPR